MLPFSSARRSRQATTTAMSPLLFSSRRCMRLNVSSTTRRAPEHFSTNWCSVCLSVTFMELPATGSTVIRPAMARVRCVAQMSANGMDAAIKDRGRILAGKVDHPPGA